ncbi:MAG TPA: hypothetical protein VN372_00750 [Methanospirillum sp.]|nr:hypothetical protein [Methanospirillum sp.]
MILLAAVLLMFGACSSPAVAESNGTISIDPIGEQAKGETINITGTTSIETCKKIGVEIFPKKYWDSTVDYGKKGDAGKVILLDLSLSSGNSSSEINLVRFNLDGTKAFQQIPITLDHIISIAPVGKSSPEGKQWSVQINTNDGGTSFTPGSYHVNVWDASSYIQHPGNKFGNGWDVLNNKIYPSTARVNVWDIKNQRDMESAEFTIR